jgi:hypothetical protein
VATVILTRTYLSDLLRSLTDVDQLVLMLGQVR